MTTRVGIGGWWGVGEETTFGTAVTMTKFFELAPGDESLVLEQDTIEAAHTVERVVDIADTAKGPKRVSGSLAHDVRFGGGWGVLLEHLAGNRFATTGAGPYTHVMNCGQSNTALAGKGLTVEVFRDGMRAVAADVSWVYAGVRPTSFELAMTDGALVRATWTLMGASQAFTTESTPSYSTASWMKSPSDAASPTATLKYGTDASEVAYTCKSWSLKIEQAHDEIREASAPAMVEPLTSDRLMITGSAEILFLGTGASGDPFSVAYQGKTAKSLILTLEGPTAASESLVIDMADVLLTSPPDPHGAASGAIYQTIEWKAYADGAGYPAVITLINSDTTVF